MDRYFSCCKVYVTSLTYIDTHVDEGWSKSLSLEGVSELFLPVFEEYTVYDEYWDEVYCAYDCLAHSQHIPIVAFNSQDDDV